jgi:proline racemase
MKCELLEGLSSLCVSLMFCLVLVLPATIVGCAEKEKIVDIETPAGEVEVERNVETGETEVDVTRDGVDTTTQPAP